MSYEKTVWENSPSVETPISAANLNKIEDALSAAINKVSATATLNADWTQGDAIGLDFNKIGNLVISNFSATINSVVGNHMFIGNIPVGFRPTQITPFPAVFVPTGSTAYEARVVLANPNGDIQIVKNPTETGSFFCAMIYLV